MRAELIQVTPGAAAFIGQCAAICYDGKLDTDACIRRAVSCKDKGHLSTMRFAHATFHISGISRACSHQLVRHKHLDYLQRSQRYCKEHETDFVLPPDLSQVEQETIKAHYRGCKVLYNWLIKQGRKKEDARFVLPEATQTELIVTGNLQAWQDFIKLRTDPAAQWEIRKVALEIQKQLQEEIPELF